MAMQTLDTGQDKIEKIADLLRRQTLEPAEREAQGLVEAARQEAEQLMEAAREEAQELLKAARAERERERRVFEASLSQASQQAQELLRQSIEHELLWGALDLEVSSQSAQPQLVARLIEAIIGAVDREGLNAEVTAIIPNSLKPQDLIALLTQRIRERLQKGAIEIGDFAGGVQVRLHGQRLVIDITDGALISLLKRFIRKDSRKLFFGEA